MSLYFLFFLDKKKKQKKSRQTRCLRPFCQACATCSFSILYILLFLMQFTFEPWLLFAVLKPATEALERLLFSWEWVSCNACIIRNSVFKTDSWCTLFFLSNKFQLFCKAFSVQVILLFLLDEKKLTKKIKANPMPPAVLPGLRYMQLFYFKHPAYSAAVYI